MTRPPAASIAAKSAKNRAAHAKTGPVTRKPARRHKEPPKPAAHATRTPDAELGHKRGSPGEELLAFQLRFDRIPCWEREFRFHPTRRWRLDFAFPQQKLGIEIDGGVWLAGGGRHNRGAGFEADMSKTNALALAGWRLLRYTPAMVKSGQALCDIQLALMP